MKSIVLFLSFALSVNLFADNKEILRVRAKALNDIIVVVAEAEINEDKSIKTLIVKSKAKQTIDGKEVEIKAVLSDSQLTDEVRAALSTALASAKDNCRMRLGTDAYPGTRNNPQIFVSEIAPIAKNQYLNLYAACLPGVSEGYRY